MWYGIVCGLVWPSAVWCGSCKETDVVMYSLDLRVGRCGVMCGLRWRTDVCRVVWYSMTGCSLVSEVDV